MTSYRLSHGGLIDRNTPLSFQFDGKNYQGYQGDTLASALLANDVLLMGRSFKYHRPRGPITAGSAEPNALITIGHGGRTTPNQRATTQEIYQGLIAQSQNRYPCLKFDIGAVNGLLSPFLKAGFYYKTFMWPARFWEKIYEPIIRKAAGLGNASVERDPDKYEKIWAFCDLLVVGSGAAGLSAALTAARSGAQVIIADENARAGGELLNESCAIDNQAAPDFAKGLLAELESLPNVRIFTRTTVFGWYDDNLFGALERVHAHQAAPDAHSAVERLWRIKARHGILATGALERPLVFGNNDRPGIMLAGAARSYLNQYGVAIGKKTALFTNNDSGYKVALDMERAGIEVAAIIDSRASANIAYNGQATLFKNAVIRSAKGGQRIKAIDIYSYDSTTSRTIGVESVAMSGGFSPVIHLSAHRGGKPQWSDELQAFLSPQDLKGLSLVGSAAGLHTISDCFNDGANQAASIMNEMGFKAQIQICPAVENERPETGIRPFWHVKNAIGKAFVDYQNDVHAQDLHLAVQEGYDHIELAKRYTTNGMATDQGKLSNINAIGIIAEEKGLSPAQIGTTTFRPYYTPVSFGAFAGGATEKHFQPTRRSPLHDWMARQNAVYVETGLWYRAAWFARTGENHWRQSVDREVINVRNNVGFTDVSTLGKIEIFGNDAAEFLNRVYCNPFLQLKVERARYGVMLREDGFVYDDGTTSRLSENHFFMTTTTALAAGVMNHLEFCAQVLWPDLDVRLASATDQWAQMAVAGPKARDVLAKIVDEDLSNEAFPFMTARQVSLFGGKITGRLYRISFSGEIAYEIGVAAHYGEYLANALLSEGKEFGIMPYGAEALGVLRIEKGFITHAEINGTATADDLGLGKMVSTKKADFIGKAMVNRPALTRPDRLQLVGIKPLNTTQSFRAGAHILNLKSDTVIAQDQGYITSYAYSPTLQSPIALALVKAGRERHGEEIIIWDGLKGERVPAIICNPVFVDPENVKSSL